jgi:hypothetical protein
MTNVIRPLRKHPQTLLNQRLAFAVQARGRFIQNQDFS